MRKKSQTLAWRRSMSSAKKATEHPQWYSLSAMAAAAVMAAAVAAGATRMSAAEVAVMVVAATVVEDAITDAEAAVASASFLVVAAVVAVVVTEAIGAGLMAYALGAPILIMAISAADLGAVLLGAQKNMVRLVAGTAILLCSIAMARAQQPEGAPSAQQQTCVYAGGSYSEGAEFCITNHAGLKCADGKWSRDTQLDCGETADEQMTPQGEGGKDHVGHMMPDQQMMPDHMMHQ
jgi:hypothetical protein